MRYNQPCVCGRSSSGRARPCQGRGSEFEPRRPLQKRRDTRMCVSSFLERHFCYAKVVACGRMTERERENPQRFPPSHSPFLAVCGSAGNRYSCHAAKAAWQLSFPEVLSPAGSALSAIPSAPETRSPGASAGSAVSTALQGGPHSPYPVRTSARTCW